MRKIELFSVTLIGCFQNLSQYKNTHTIITEHIFENVIYKQTSAHLCIQIKLGQNIADANYYAIHFHVTS